MTIATKNGSVILKSGSVAQTCACCVSLCDESGKPRLSLCPDRIDYLYGPVYDGIPPGFVVPKFQEIPASVQTVTVPQHFSLPVLVRFCGGADDGIAIDGVRKSFFGQPVPDVVIHNRTFTVGTWNDGGPSAGGVSMCFYEYNPLP